MVLSIDNTQLYKNPIINAIGFNNLIINKSNRYESDILKKFMSMNGDKIRISIPHTL